MKYSYKKVTSLRPNALTATQNHTIDGIDQPASIVYNRRVYLLSH